MFEDDDFEDICVVDFDELSVVVVVFVVVELEQFGEEQESIFLNVEVSQIDSVVGGDMESYCEQVEFSGGKESKLDELFEFMLGGL